HIRSGSRRLGDYASSRSVRYRTALRPERLDAKALRCRDAQERLPHPASPVLQNATRASPLTARSSYPLSVSAARRLPRRLPVSSTRERNVPPSPPILNAETLPGGQGVRTYDAPAAAH